MCFDCAPVTEKKIENVSNDHFPFTTSNIHPEGEKLTVQAVGAPLPGATVNTFSFPLIVGLPPPQLVSVGRVVEVKLNRPGTFRAPDDEVVTGVAAHPTAIPELG